MFCREGAQHYGMSRREALEIGIGLFGLSLPQWLQAKSHSREGKDISCIFLFLAGGPSHFETFDPKPNAREGIRGLWKPTRTNVPGTLICEKLPLLAKMADKYAIVRSWQGKSGSHAGGSQHVNSGVNPGGRKQHFPNFGCVVAALQGTKEQGIPPHVGLPVAARYTNPTGYLGPAYGPYNVTGDPSSPEFKVGNLTLPRERLESRRGLLDQIDNLGRMAESQAISLSARDGFLEEAYATLTSGKMQQAARLSGEPLKLRERYGMNIYGQRVLLARRLIEAGCRFVTINQAVQGGPYTSPNRQTAGTWDNHSDIFSFLMTFGGTPPRGRKAHKNWQGYEGPGNLPQLDMSLSALIEDLDQRGLLKSTLVVAIGEFGRTPKINKNGGRDHYPKAGCALLAGGPIKGGIVVGATDRDGTEPTTRPWHPEDFAATLYHALGIDANTTYYPRLPRPTKIAEGEVITELFTESI